MTFLKITRIYECLKVSHTRLTHMCFEGDKTSIEALALQDILSYSLIITKTRAGICEGRNVL